MFRCSVQCFLLLMLVAMANPAMAIDKKHADKGRAAAAKAIAFLRSTQNADGGWSPKAGPAVTALIVNGMMDQPDIDANDPAVARGYEFILSKAKPDGGIHDGLLANYNTSICLSALSRLVDAQNPPKSMTPLQKRALEAMKNGEKYIRTLQFVAGVDSEGNPINEKHPYFGGVGYAEPTSPKARPDGSNTQFFVQALIDMNVDCKDPAIVNAVQFFSKLQGEYVPQKPTGSGAAQESGDKRGDDPNRSSLRAYGSMSYAMFKTYVYAQLPKNDPRVTHAVDWLRKNYTVTANPGMPAGKELQGYFYYIVTMTRALDAWSSQGGYLTDAKGQKIDWAGDLIDHMAKLQKENGSFINESDRWMEADPNLTTAFSLIGLTQALRQ